MVEPWRDGTPPPSSSGKRGGCGRVVAVALFAVLAALGIGVAVAAPAHAASTYMSNSSASVSNIVAATTCSGSVLGSSKLVLAPGQISYQFGAGMFIPSNRKAKLYRSGTYVRTVTGPYTQCAGGYSWRAQVTS